MEKQIKLTNTLSGKGITYAYTKAEINGKLTDSMHFKGNVNIVSALPTSRGTLGLGAE